MKIALFLHTFKGILRFGGTPEKINGTLVRRGTQVEKHCARGSNAAREHQEK